MAARSEYRFDDLYQTHRSSVWLYCRRRVGVDLADDAMGDVFLAVWRRIGEAPDSVDALPWLYRISYLTVSNHWRSAGRRKRLLDKVSAMGVTPPHPIADQVVVREKVRLVVDLLTKLRASDAEILRLVAWEQLNTDQVASVLDISPDAAKQRLSRARRRLTKMYDNKKTRRIHDAPPLLGKEVSGEQ
ncbi:MAG: RNA polymerase sigma factor [Acidimicrobiia bacterium]